MTGVERSSKREIRKGRINERKTCGLQRWEGDGINTVRQDT